MLCQCGAHSCGLGWRSPRTLTKYPKVHFQVRCICDQSFLGLSDKDRSY